MIRQNPRTFRSISRRSSPVLILVFLVFLSGVSCDSGSPDEDLAGEQSAGAEITGGSPTGGEVAGESAGESAGEITVGGMVPIAGTIPTEPVWSWYDRANLRDPQRLGAIDPEAEEDSESGRHQIGARAVEIVLNESDANQALGGVQSMVFCYSTSPNGVPGELTGPSLPTGCFLVDEPVPDARTPTPLRPGQVAYRFIMPREQHSKIEAESYLLPGTRFNLPCGKPRSSRCAPIKPGTSVYYRWFARGIIPDRYHGTELMSFVMPRPILIAIFGDSFGSGEGAPADFRSQFGQWTTTSYNSNPEPSYSYKQRNAPSEIQRFPWPWIPYHTGSSCHRSIWSGHELALQRISLEHDFEELAFDHINTTCTGATVNRVMNSPQSWETWWSHQVQTSIAQTWLTERDYIGIYQSEKFTPSIDIALLSIGGNDAEFVDLILNMIGYNLGNSLVSGVSALISNELSKLARIFGPVMYWPMRLLLRHILPPIVESVIRIWLDEEELTTLSGHLVPGDDGFYPGMRTNVPNLMERLTSEPAASHLVFSGYPTSTRGCSEDVDDSINVGSAYLFWDYDREVVGGVCGGFSGLIYTIFGWVVPGPILSFFEDAGIDLDASEAQLAQSCEGMLIDLVSNINIPFYYSRYSFNDLNETVAAPYDSSSDSWPLVDEKLYALNGVLREVIQNGEHPSARFANTDRFTQYGVCYPWSKRQTNLIKDANSRYRWMETARTDYLDSNDDSMGISYGSQFFLIWHPNQRGYSQVTAPALVRQLNSLFHDFVPQSLIAQFNPEWALLPQADYVTTQRFNVLERIAPAIGLLTDGVEETIVEVELQTINVGSVILEDPRTTSRVELYLGSRPEQLDVQIAEVEVPLLEPQAQMVQPLQLIFSAGGRAKDDEEEMRDPERPDALVVDVPEAMKWASNTRLKPLITPMRSRQTSEGTEQVWSEWTPTLYDRVLAYLYPTAWYLTSRVIIGDEGDEEGDEERIINNTSSNPRPIFVRPVISPEELDQVRSELESSCDLSIPTLDRLREMIPVFSCLRVPLGLGALPPELREGQGDLITREERGSRRQRLARAWSEGVQIAWNASLPTRTPQHPTAFKREDGELSYVRSQAQATLHLDEGGRGGDTGYLARYKRNAEGVISLEPSAFPMDGRVIDAQLIMETERGLESLPIALQTPWLNANITESSRSQIVHNGLAQLEWAPGPNEGMHRVKIGVEGMPESFLSRTVYPYERYISTEAPQDGRPLTVRLSTRHEDRWLTETYQIPTAQVNARLIVTEELDADQDGEVSLAVELPPQGSQYQYRLRLGDRHGPFTPSLQRLQNGEEALGPDMTPLSSSYYDSGVVGAAEALAGFRVARLPRDGRPIALTLSTRRDGKWSHERYRSFTASVEGVPRLASSPDILRLMGSQTTLRWEKIEGADRYRITLLDEGRTLGETEISPEELSYELNPIPWTDSELLTIALGARVAGEWVESRYLFERPLIPILSGGNFNDDGSIPSRAILEWTPIDNATSYQVSLICSSTEGVINLNYRAFTPRIAIEDPLPEGAMCLLSLSARFGEERVGSASEVYFLVESRRVEREPDVCDPLSSLPWDQVAVEDEGRWVVDGQLSGRGRVEGSCGGEGPERIYHFVAPESGQWRFSTAHLETDADTVLYVRQDCSETGSELACNDDDGLNGQQRGSVVTFTLNQGDEAFIFVDSTESTSRQDAGRFKLTATVDTEGVTQPSDPALVGATCQQAPEITITPTAGEIEVVESWQIPIQGLSLFTGSCGGAGPEWVGDFTAIRSGSWRFTLRGPSELALYLRSACTRPESERTSRCSSPDERVVSVTTALQQGELITVFADTMEPNHSGVYTLEARWLGR